MHGLLTIGKSCWLRLVCGCSLLLILGVFICSMGCQFILFFDLPVCSCNTAATGSAVDTIPLAGTDNVSPYLVEMFVPTNSILYPYNHAASLLALSNGDLLVVWVAGSRELADDTVILLSRKPSGQDAWESPIIVADTPGRPDGNPVLYLDGDQQIRLLYVSIRGQTFCEGTIVTQLSRDDGLSWSVPVDYLQAACVMIRNKPIQTRSGRWILPGYVQAVYQSQFWFSDDAGATWCPTASMLTWPNNLQPAIAELSDGSLLAMMRSGDGGGFTWQGRSDNDGATWTLCRRAELPNPNSGLDLLRLSTGELVLVGNDSPTQRTPLSVWISVDDGCSWSSPRVIAEGDPQLSYPSLAEDADGNIHVAYSHRLDSIHHVKFNRAWLLGSGY